MGMRGTKRNLLVSLFVAVVIIGGLSTAGSATTAVKTNAGRVLQGDLSGLATVLRLEDPTPPIGPAAQFDIPLDSIQQMWIDFPRVVIETAEHVIVGPYSAFAGIAQLLKIEDAGDVTEVPFTAVQAIAFDGASFKPLPREWLGRNWLNQPLYVMNKVAGAAREAAAPAETVTQVTTTTTTDEGDEIIWNPGTVEAAPTTSGEGFPWWVALVAVAVVVGLFFLLPAGSGS